MRLSAPIMIPLLFLSTSVTMTPSGILVLALVTDKRVMVDESAPACAAEAPVRLAAPASARDPPITVVSRHFRGRTGFPAEARCRDMRGFIVAPSARVLC